MTVIIDKCLKCDWPLSPSQIERKQSHCEYCKAIVKGEEEAKHQQDLSNSLGNANKKAMR